MPSQLFFVIEKGFFEVKDGEFPVFNGIGSFLYHRQELHLKKPGFHVFYHIYQSIKKLIIQYIIKGRGNPVEKCDDVFILLKFD